MSIPNFNFSSNTSGKNKLRNGQKIKFVRLDFSKIKRISIGVKFTFSEKSKKMCTAVLKVLKSTYSKP